MDHSLHELNEVGARLADGLLQGLNILSVLVWLGSAWRIYQRRPLLTYTPRRAAPWQLVDIVLILLFVGWTVYSSVATPPVELKNDTPIESLFALNALLRLALMGGYATLVALRTQAAPVDFGLSVRNWKQQFKVGLVALAMFAGPVLLIQRTLVEYSGQKSEHPLVTQLFQQPTPAAMILFALNVLVVAPLVEEVMYRVLLQGWLEKVCTGRAATGEESAAPPSGWVANALPILLSATLFAVSHLRFLDGKVQPDPLPLFVLAVGLGYVYRRTHRLLPIVLIHAGLNLISTLMVVIQVYCAK